MLIPTEKVKEAVAALEKDGWTFNSKPGLGSN